MAGASHERAPGEILCELCIEAPLYSDIFLRFQQLQVKGYPPYSLCFK